MIQILEEQYKNLGISREVYEFGEKMSVGVSICGSYANFVS